MRGGARAGTGPAAGQPSREVGVVAAGWGCGMAGRRGVFCVRIRDVCCRARRPVRGCARSLGMRECGTPRGTTAAAICAAGCVAMWGDVRARGCDAGLQAWRQWRGRVIYGSRR